MNKKKKITPELRAEIIAYNKTLSGTVSSRCARLKSKFGYCAGVLANVINDKSKGVKARDTTPITAVVRKEIIDLYNSQSENVGEAYKIGKIASKLNRSSLDIKNVIERENEKKGIKMFNHKDPFHCFI